jgi:hypothetical protein
MSSRDARRRVARGDPVAAGEREFGAAAHADAVDRRDGRAGQAAQAQEDALAVLERVLHRAVLLEAFEFLDVGADDEAIRLARADDHALRRLDREAFDDLGQLVEHRARKRVDRALGTVQRQHHDAVGVAGRLPMLETQAFEHDRLRERLGGRL